jgi:hypothetical protein
MLILSRVKHTRHVSPEQMERENARGAPAAAGGLAS